MATVGGGRATATLRGVVDDGTEKDDGSGGRDSRVREHAGDRVEEPGSKRSQEGAAERVQVSAGVCWVAFQRGNR